MARISLLALVAVGGLAACGALPDDVDTSRDPVSGGTVVTSNTDPYDAVVKMNPLGCTATKIGSRRFLTAGHCATSLAVSGTIQLTSSIAGTGGGTFTITRVDVHPSYHLFKGESYDVGVFEVSADSPGFRTLPLRSAYVTEGLLGVIVGYGCDNTSTDDGKKQWAHMRAGSTANFDIMAHYVFVRSDTVASCSGDSGGPYLIRTGVNTGIWEIAGVVLGHDGEVPLELAKTYFSRTSNVRQWIQAPGHNDFSNGSVGTFLNGGSGKCLGVDGNSTAPDAQVMQFYCDGRQQPADNQYWRLQSIGSGHFLVKNTRSNLCLGVDGASTADGARIAQYGCDPTPTTTENQAWRFAFAGTVAGTNYYQIRNGKSGKCIGIESGSTANAARAFQFGCSTPAVNNRAFLFSR